MKYSRKEIFQFLILTFLSTSLTMHISFFYSSFSNFLNNLLQITAYAIYLLIADINTVASFSIGILLLIYPIVKLLAKSRLFMHESYEKSQEANKEVERVVDNLFLIKILKKEKFEISRFLKLLMIIYSMFTIITNLE